MDSTVPLRCAVPFFALCGALPELLNGWAVFKIARLCRAARQDASAFLPSLRIALRQLAELAVYLEREQDLQVPGFEPGDGLLVRMYALFQWEPPNHLTLCTRVGQLMATSCNSFNFCSSGNGNDFSLWARAHPTLIGMSPLEMLQHMNGHLKSRAAFKRCLKLLAHSRADFMYSPRVADGMAHLSQCAGPGLIIALRWGTMSVAFGLCYTQSTYRKKIYWPWVASLNTRNNAS